MRRGFGDIFAILGHTIVLFALLSGAMLAAWLYIVAGPPTAEELSALTDAYTHALHSALSFARSSASALL